MRTLHFLFLLFMLSILSYTAPTAEAQSRGNRDDRLRQDRREAADRARAEKGERTRQGEQWAAQRRLPRRIPQTNGRTVELVGAEGKRPLYVTSLNQFSATTTGTIALYPGQKLGLNLTGSGMTLGVWDAGHALPSHQEFTGRLSTGDQGPNDDHATHVAGTMAAAGVVSQARGMAYDAAVRSYDWNADIPEMSREAEKGMLVSNHSYGLIAGWYYGDLEDKGTDQWYWLGDPRISTEEDYTFGLYTKEASLYDGVAFAYPYYLAVIAAGNDRSERGPSSGAYRALDAAGNWQTYTVEQAPHPRDGGDLGYDSIVGSALAKNVLTVGSIGVDGSANPRISSFSSFGPSDDGRVKPDIVGYGERVYSPVSAGNKPDQNYGTYSGTSMATPNVSGSLILLQQYHHQLSGAYMLASTLKGLAIHTARDLGKAGPDYQYGWGLLNLEAAAETIRDMVSNPVALVEDQLTDGLAYVRNVSVHTPGPVKLTLVWTDRPGVETGDALDAPTPSLRNDLDLRLVNDATGEVYLPYLLSVSRPDQEAARGDNTVDPVEQVYIPFAPAGTYSIVVTHKSGLVAGTPQVFSLIVSGASEAPRSVSVALLDAEPAADRVTLSWRTNFERRKGAFQVQRQSITFGADGKKVLGEALIVGTVNSGEPTESGNTYTFTDKGTLAGDYLYQLLFVSSERATLVSEVETTVLPPEHMAALSNYPNPFTDRTVLVLDVPDSRSVTLEVYNTLGQRVAVVFEGVLPPGRHELPVETSGWAAGVYFARVHTRDTVLTHRMVVVR